MTIQTPSYWEDEFYHPLIEVETAYGNKLHMPERYLFIHEMLSKQKKFLLENMDKVKAAGRLDHTNDYRKRFAIDLWRVYFEVYQEIKGGIYPEDTFKFYKKNPDDSIWWVDNFEANGERLFSFDQKYIFNLFCDYPRMLTPEQKRIFDNENPGWKEYFRNRNTYYTGDIHHDY